MILDPLPSEPETLQSTAVRGSAARVPTGGRNETADWGLGARISAALGVFRRYPELALLALLLVLTATFSRSFSKGASIGPIYVTEVVMVLSAAIAVLRHGIGESWRLLRRLPLPALALIWVVGAIAALRGLADYSLDFVENDIGLVDYTLLLPVLALVVADRERYGALYGALVACGFAGMAAFFLAYTADQVTGEANTLLTLQGSAAGLYMSLAVVWIAARIVNRVPTPRWLMGLLPVGLVLMGLTTQRSVWMIAVVSLLVVVLMAPAPRLRMALAIAGAFVVGLGGAVAIQAGLNATTGGVEATGGERRQLRDEVRGRGASAHPGDHGAGRGRELGGPERELADRVLEGADLAHARRAAPRGRLRAARRVHVGRAQVRLP